MIKTNDWPSLTHKYVAENDPFPERNAWEVEMEKKAIKKAKDDINFKNIVLTSYFHPAIQVISTDFLRKCPSNAKLDLNSKQNLW